MEGGSEWYFPHCNLKFVEDAEAWNTFQMYPAQAPAERGCQTRLFFKTGKNVLELQQSTEYGNKSNHKLLKTKRVPKLFGPSHTEKNNVYPDWLHWKQVMEFQKPTELKQWPDCPNALLAKAESLCGKGKSYDPLLDGTNNSAISLQNIGELYKTVCKKDSCDLQTVADVMNCISQVMDECCHKEPKASFYEQISDESIYVPYIKAGRRVGDAITMISKRELFQRLFKVTLAIKGGERAAPKARNIMIQSMGMKTFQWFWEEMFGFFCSLSPECVITLGGNERMKEIDKIINVGNSWACNGIPVTTHSGDCTAYNEQQKLSYHDLLCFRNFNNLLSPNLTKVLVFYAASWNMCAHVRLAPIIMYKPLGGTQVREPVHKVIDLLEKGELKCDPETKRQLEVLKDYIVADGRFTLLSGVTEAMLMGLRNNSSTKILAICLLVAYLIAAIMLGAKDSIRHIFRDSSDDFYAQHQPTEKLLHNYTTFRECAENIYKAVSSVFLQGGWSNSVKKHFSTECAIGEYNSKAITNEGQKFPLNFMISSLLPDGKSIRADVTNFENQVSDLKSQVAPQTTLIACQVFTDELRRMYSLPDFNNERGFYSETHGILHYSAKAIGLTKEVLPISLGGLQPWSATNSGHSELAIKVEKLAVKSEIAAAAMFEPSNPMVNSEQTTVTKTNQGIKIVGNVDAQVAFDANMRPPTKTKLLNKSIRNRTQYSPIIKQCVEIINPALLIAENLDNRNSYEALKLALQISSGNVSNETFDIQGKRKFNDASSSDEEPGPSKRVK